MALPCTSPFLSSSPHPPPTSAASLSNTYTPIPNHTHPLECQPCMHTLPLSLSFCGSTVRSLSMIHQLVQKHLHLHRDHNNKIYEEILFESVPYPPTILVPFSLPISSLRPILFIFLNSNSTVKKLRSKRSLCVHHQNPSDQSIPSIKSNQTSHTH